MNPYKKFKWNKIYPDMPDFDFIEECKEDGAVKWWNETEFVLDMRKLKETTLNKNSKELGQKLLILTKKMRT